MIVVVFLIFCGFYTTCQKSTKYLKKLLVLFFVAKNLFDAQTILDFSKQLRGMTKVTDTIDFILNEIHQLLYEGEYLIKGASSKDPSLDRQMLLCQQYFIINANPYKTFPISKTCCTCLREKTTNLATVSHQSIQMNG